MRALSSRLFPQPSWSNVVAPSGGVQRTALTRNEGAATAPQTHPRTGGTIHCQGDTRVTSNLSIDPLLSYTYPIWPRFPYGGVKGLMGCKQYARILGLSRGYPYILYLSLSKWDAALRVAVFHKRSFCPRWGEKLGGTIDSVPLVCPMITRSFTGPLRLRTRVSVAPHASISARTEVRRLRSEIGKFRRVNWRRFSTPAPIAT